MNKVRNDEERETIEEKLNIPIIYAVPYREEVVKADLKGVSVYDLYDGMMDEMNELKDKLVGI